LSSLEQNYLKGAEDCCAAMVFNFFSILFVSLGYLIRTPSTADEEATDSLIKYSLTSGSFKYGFVSFKDFFFMVNYTTAEL
jgi:hypothetical protein